MKNISALLKNHATLKTKFILYAKLMRVHKPIGFFLLLWPTLMALWIATKGHPSLFMLGIFASGTFIMRCAGCVINDFFDQRFDGKVRRTQDRPLVQGFVSQKEALILFVVLMLCAQFLVLQLNIQTILLACAAAILAILYPLMKRIMHLPQAILGIAFAWSIPMVFMAIQERIPVDAWILFGATILWVIAYDTEYAMADHSDDLKIGVKSTAILFGAFDKIMIFLLQIGALVLFSLLGFRLQFDLIYFISIIFASLCMLYQQYLIKDRNSMLCLQAFLNNNYVGALICMGCIFEFFSLS